MSLPQLDLVVACIDGPTATTNLVVASLSTPYVSDFQPPPSPLKPRLMFRLPLDTGGECVPSDGTIEDGDCRLASGGCCDSAYECNGDGTCSLPPFGCTDDTCEDGETCLDDAACASLDADVTFSGFDDGDSPYVGVLSYEFDHVYLVGEGDPSGEYIDVTEAMIYNEEAGGDVHVLFDESGMPRSAYVEGSEGEVVYFVYDDNGHLVNATDKAEDVSENGRRLSPSMVTDIYSLQNYPLQERELLSFGRYNSICRIRWAVFVNIWCYYWSLRYHPFRFYLLVVCRITLILYLAAIRAGPRCR